MCRQMKRIFTLALLLLHHTVHESSFALAAGDATGSTVRVNYEDLLFNEWSDDRLSLVLPRVLLEDYDGDDAAEIGLSDECRRELRVYKGAIDRKERWALKMQDASSKTASGIFHGNIIDLGAYDECVGTATKSAGLDIHGRHCTYTIKPTALDKNFLPIYPLLSICLPSTCESEDVASLFNNSISAIEELEKFEISIGSALCSENRYKTSYTGFIIFLAIMTLHISFLAFCTYCHVAYRQIAPEKRSKRLTTLVRFSFLENSKAIWSLRSPEDDVRIMHGIRVLSTGWIILLHECVFQLFRANANFLDLQWYFSSWLILIPLLGMYCVDTFFTLSGFLVSYQFFRKMKRDKQISLPRYYLHRFLRLTPPVAVVLYAGVAFVPKLASGPRWDWFFNIFITGCCTKWWSILTYTQNFVDRDNWCLYHLWSLAVDMQLFLISPLILYPLYRRPKIGKTIIVALLSATIIVNALILGYKKYSAIYLSHEPSIPTFLENMKDIYQMPYTRAAPWLIGLWFGYEAHQENSKLSKPKLYFGWFLSVASLLFCVFGTKSFTELSYQYNPTWEIIFAAVQKSAWSFPICWVIYTEFRSVKGWMSKVLSSPIFLPFSRISYSVYLIHLVSPLLQVGTTRTSAYINAFTITQTYISNLVISVVLGFLFSVIYERPAMVLEDMILKEKAPVSRDVSSRKEVETNGITVEKETSCRYQRLIDFVLFCKKNL